MLNLYPCLIENPHTYIYYIPHTISHIVFIYQPFEMWEVSVPHPVLSGTKLSKNPKLISYCCIEFYKLQTVTCPVIKITGPLSLDQVFQIQNSIHLIINISLSKRDGTSEMCIGQSEITIIQSFRLLCYITPNTRGTIV